MRAALVVLMLVLGGCASLLSIRDVKDVAGVWRGRILGPLGHGTATLTIREDGGYTGTVYLDGGDREFSGRLTVVGRQVRYLDAGGTGTVTLDEHAGRRVLRFVSDGGGAVATYSPER
jgi:hypothetical protein